MIKRKMITDSILSIIAAAIPILVLQLVILPIIASRLGDIQYGLAVTLISMASLLSLPFGNVLNNIRLLLDGEYQENKISGDFNILLLVGMVTNAIMIIIGTIYYEGGVFFFSILLIVVFSGFNLMREYLIVSFRIKIDYKSILINNVFLGSGYFLGLLLFLYTGYWQFVYLVGAGFSLLYINKKSDLIREPFRKTKFFGKTSYKSGILFISSFIKSILTYADKMLLFPLLGPVAVSVYYAATLMGKMISMTIMPISSVMLSYLAKMEKMKIKIFIQIIVAVTAVGSVGYVVILLISTPILHLLYPNWAEESLKLIHITTATAIVGMISAVIHPIILRFNHINWQLIINGINLVIYVASVFIFYNLYELVGFCLGMLVASVIKLSLMVFVFLLGYHNRQVKARPVE